MLEVAVNTSNINSTLHLPSYTYWLLTVLNTLIIILGLTGNVMVFYAAIRLAFLLPFFNRF